MRPERLELPAYWFEASRSIQLSYGRVPGNSTIWSGCTKVNRLEAAGALAKLDGDDASFLADTKKKLAPLDKTIDLFRQHEWEFVARDMWTKLEAEPRTDGRRHHAALDRRQRCHELAVPAVPERASPPTRSAPRR